MPRGPLDVVVAGSLGLALGVLAVLWARWFDTVPHDPVAAGAGFLIDLAVAFSVHTVLHELGHFFAALVVRLPVIGFPDGVVTRCSLALVEIELGDVAQGRRWIAMAEPANSGDFLLRLASAAAAARPTA